MPKIKIDSEKCKGCHLCIDVCPLNLISVSDKFNKKGFAYVIADSERCTGCSMCFQICPDCAIEVEK